MSLKKELFTLAAALFAANGITVIGESGIGELL